MAGQKIPYPPSPEDVPEDLTDFPATYRSQQNLLLIGLFMFLLMYLGLICLCALLGTWCFFTLKHFFPIKVIGLIFCGTFFLFLVKGFFKRQPIDKTMHIEITEDEQPILFGFIHQLVDELGAPEPNRVFVSPDVNAAVIPRTSLINLIVQPKKDLLIGLGLVNCTNMSEFKSVLAHEFGHFCQSGYTSSYSYVAYRIILDLVEGEDWFDRMIDFCKRQQNALSIFGYLIGAPVWLGRKVLWWLLKALTLQRLAVMREAEFHADLVAVKAAGSDAVGLSLMRLRFGNICLMQAIHDMSQAADHKLYTRDMFYHQEHAEPIVRRLKKKPELGARPVYDDPMAGKDHRVFDPDEEEVEHDEIPEMRRTHPPAHETEENAKETFVPAVVDIRSPWLLFTDAAELKERLTYKFYRMAFKIKKDTDLDEAQKVQEYIDGEHADTTYDPKYQGIYDDRPLDPGELAELNRLTDESPWNEERIDKVFEKLYDGAAGKHEEYDDLRKEKATLENTPGRPSSRMKKKIDKIGKQMDKIWEWFQSLDRRVYLVHVQMGRVVNREWADELVERYRFQMEIQRLYQEARFHQNKAYAFANFLFNQPQDQVHPELVAEVMQVLRQAWKALKNILKDAREINLPAMRNFEEGERLADFILEDKLLPELPLSYVKGKWVGKLLDQLETVKSRCFRLHWKSVGGILGLQEKIAAAWQQHKDPVEAAVVVDAVEAEPAEIVEAVVAEPVDVMVAEVVEATPAPPVATPADAVLTAEVVEDDGGEVFEAAVVEEAPAAPPPTPKARTPVAVPPPAPRVAPAPPLPPEPEPEHDHAFVIPEEEPAAAPVAAAPEPESVFVSPAEPVAEAPVTHHTPARPEPEPAPDLPADKVAEIFVLDMGAHRPAVSSEQTQLHEALSEVNDPGEQAVGDIFSLDAGGTAARAPTRPVERTAPPAAAKPVSADEEFSLDADAHPAPPADAAEVVFTFDADAQPAAVAEPSPPPVGSATLVAPAPRLIPVLAPTPAASAPTVIEKPAKNGRPAIKITLVRPGEKSPLAK